MSYEQLTPQVQALADINIAGNVIPSHWYKHITFANGKPYAIAVILLSDIVYWYRPTIEMDEATGQIKSIKKKFKADFLQRQTKAFSEQFGFSEKQIRDALKYLEDNKYIKRHFRDVDLGIDAGKASNRQFIELIPEKVIELQKVHTYGRRSQYPETSTSRGSNADVTYTDTTPESSSEKDLSVTDKSVSKISFISKEKKQTTLTDTDVYFRISKERFECLTSEVNYAMEALSKTTSIVYDWWAFIKGTIEKYRNKKKSENICNNNQKKRSYGKTYKENSLEKDIKEPQKQEYKCLQDVLNSLQSG
jgi:hypothetical protein